MVGSLPSLRVKKFRSGFTNMYKNYNYISNNYKIF